MSNLLSTLSSAANALSVFDRSLNTAQNNVENSSTAGYARQTASLEAVDFQPTDGYVGGVRSAGLLDSRDQFAEASVRTKVSVQGSASAKAGVLTEIQSLFDVSGKSGIATSVDRLMQSFSAWSITPSSASARQEVLTAATAAGGNFQQTAKNLSQIRTNTDAQISTTVAKINDLGKTIAKMNQEAYSGDPALSARMHDALEQLSSLTGITVLNQADGSKTVLIGGQTPLVMGDKAFTLATQPNGAAGTNVVDADGKVVTGQIGSGELAGLLEVRNQVLPGILGDGTAPGTLNDLAQSFAGRINTVLSGGLVSVGPPSVSGAPVFTFDSTPGRAALTLAVDPAVTATQLGAIAPGTPPQSNRIALQLSLLGTSKDPEDQIGGQNYQDFWGGIVSGVGAKAKAASDDRDQALQLVTQARNLRNDISGVSLDQEAARIIELQKCYQAISKVVSIMNDLTGDILNMVH